MVQADRNCSSGDRAACEPDSSRHAARKRWRSTDLFQQRRCRIDAGDAPGWYWIEELHDPAYNINYGSQMLAGLYAKYGSYREALFHYGPMDMGYYYADLVLRIWETYT